VFAPDDDEWSIEYRGDHTGRGVIGSGGIHVGGSTTRGMLCDALWCSVVLSGALWCSMVSNACFGVLVLRDFCWVHQYCGVVCGAELLSFCGLLSCKSHQACQPSSLWPHLPYRPYCSQGVVARGPYDYVVGADIVYPHEQGSKEAHAALMQSLRDMVKGETVALIHHSER
jgi:hypothetical protein